MSKFQVVKEKIVAFPSKFLSGGKRSGQYLRLLVSSGPETLDYVLLIVGFISSIASGVPFPILGILFGQLVDDLNSTSCSTSATTDTSSITNGVRTKVLDVIYVTIANFVLIYVHTGCWSLLGERLVRRLRRTYLNVLLRQEVAFFDKLPSGEVASRLDVDLQTIQTGTSEKVGIFIASISYFVASYVVAFIKSATLAGMLISLVPAFLLMALVGGHFTQKYASRVSDHVAAATAIASAGLSNMPLVQAMGASSRLEAVYAKHIGLAQKEGMKKAFVASVQLGCLYFIAYSANALAFWQGSREIASSVDKNGSNTTIGAVYTVIFLLVDSSFIVSQIAPFMQIFAAASGAFEKIVATIHRKSEIDGTSSDGEAFSTLPGDLKFENVAFAYPSRPEVEVLKSFSLTIPANKHTAMVGLSGSGKSTVAALVQRLYDPIQGEVYLGGRNLRDINVRCVRSFIGTVAQNSTLLDRSILENIAYGLVNSPLEEHVKLRGALLDASLPDLAHAIREGASYEQAVSASSADVQRIVQLVRDAAAEADALSFIDRLQYGLATMAGPGGNRLSGGQKQRVALARAIVRSPSILLLDEATASLDSVSEHLIQSALDRVSKGRTTISIAHRLSTIKKADNIVVMGHGEILEQGTYSELISRDGAFANLVRLQTLAPSDRPISEIETESSNDDEDVLQEKADYADFTRVKSLEAPGNATPPVKESVSKDSLAEKDEKAPATKRSLTSTFFGILSMARPHLLYVFFGIAGAIVIGGTYSAEAVIFGHTVSSLSPCLGSGSIRHSGILYGGLFFMLAGAEFLANVISASSFGRVSEKLLYRVRVLALKSLFSQDIQWHESEGRSPGTLISYISSDANALSGITGTILGVMLSIVVSMISGIILAHVVAWRIAIVLLACVPVLLASGFLRLKVLARFHERHAKAFAHSVSIATEAVGAIKTVAIFSLEEETVQVFNRSLKAPYTETLKTIACGNFWLAMAYSMSNLVYALAYWWGARNVSEGRYSQMQFFIVLPALLFSAQLCGQMFSLAPDISKAGVSAARVLDLIDIGPEKNLAEERPRLNDLESCQSASEKPPSGKGGLSVKFNDVRFSYPARPDIEVLRGLDISIQPGTFCALVGRSGAGKSTIISLLERFYTPSAGSVKIDNRDISKLEGTSFRDDIALVPQESVLFDGTVRFNLELGARPGHVPSTAEIEEACKLANIHDTIISLPEGYDNPCGSNGGQFSGGQLQRLSIARAFLRKPRLLLLDESTSALDAESEKLFEEALEKTTKGVTVIAIAHRLRTIRRAERIFVIDDGKCVDAGRHEELVERNESYRANAAHQTL
ncbi:leptomycin B resistance pmd1 protein [Rutstroemia sp. NJR-2017a WRK4]|nr:leptomycin B resistance pmd1 protein [Rutstroemia sp. NJR-2017a WRK4]